MKDLVIIGNSETSNRVTQFIRHYNLYNIIGFQSIKSIAVLQNIMDFHYGL